MGALEQPERVKPQCGMIESCLAYTKPGSKNSKA